MRRLLISQVQINYVEIMTNVFVWCNIHVDKDEQQKMPHKLLEDIDKMSQTSNITPELAQILQSSGYTQKDFNSETFFQLVKLFEDKKSKNPQENAFKLTVVFAQYDQAINYLTRYEKQPLTKTIDDACTFDLPAANEWTLSLWQDLIAYHKPNSPSDLLFRLLPYAHQIETYVKNNSDKIKNEIVAEVKDKYYRRLMMQERNLSSKAQFSFASNYVPTLYRIATFLHLIKDKKEKILDKYHVRGKIQAEVESKFKKCFCSHTDISTLLKYAHGAYYEFGYENLKAAELFFKHRFSEESFNHYRWLEPKDNDCFIPNVEILGRSIADKYHLYYLKKLDPHNPAAALLGVWTSCCQVIDDRYGGTPTIHGICDERSGFYVLYKMKDEYPSDNDTPVAQCWAWRGEKNEMVFDSIEIQKDTRRHSEQMVNDFFVFLADYLVKYKAVPCVLAGRCFNEGIEYELGDLLPLESPCPVDYYEFRDSWNARYLAHEKFPIVSLYKSIHPDSLLPEKIQTVNPNDFEDWQTLCFYNLQSLMNNPVILIKHLHQFGIDDNVSSVSNSRSHI